MSAIFHSKIMQNSWLLLCKIPHISMMIEELRAFAIYFRHTHGAEGRYDLSKNPLILPI
jgi:hypothetical protein